MQEYWDQLLNLSGEYVLPVVQALAILVLGWIFARIMSALVRKLLNKTSVDEKLSDIINDGDSNRDVHVTEWASRGVFYLIMLFVLVGFFQTLNLTVLTEPVNSLLNELFVFAPKLLGAAALFAVAWLLATVLRMLVTRGLTASKIDERIGREVGENSDEVPLTRSLADVVYWLVFLLFLPAILTTLQLDGLLTPVQGMLNKVLGFLPNIFTAAIILTVGWFIGRIVRSIVVNLSVAMGVDRLGERVGLTNALGDQKLSGVIGIIIYAFILIPVILAALNALSLDAITLPLSNMLNLILNSLPAIFAAVLIIGFAYIGGRIVSGLISNLLAGVGFDKLVSNLGLSASATDGENSPSTIAGYIVMIGIMFFAVTEASSTLGFEMLSGLLAQFTVFGGHVLMGLLIFGVGLYIARMVADLIKNSATAQAPLFATVARIAILVLAGAMALRHMGLANEIINLAFGLLLGAVAVAAAIAFGIGGRDIAAEKLAEWQKSAGAKK